MRDFELRLADPGGKGWRYHELFVTAQWGWDVFVGRRRGGGLGGEGGRGKGGKGGEGGEMREDVPS